MGGCVRRLLLAPMRGCCRVVCPGAALALHTPEPLPMCHSLVSHAGARPARAWTLAMLLGALWC